MQPHRNQCHFIFYSHEKSHKNSILFFFLNGIKSNQNDWKSMNEPLIILLWLSCSKFSLNSFFFSRKCLILLSWWLMPHRLSSKRAIISWWLFSVHQTIPVVYYRTFSVKYRFHFLFAFENCNSTRLDIKYNF